MPPETMKRETMLKRIITGSVLLAAGFAVVAILLLTQPGCSGPSLDDLPTYTPPTTAPPTIWVEGDLDSIKQALVDIQKSLSSLDNDQAEQLLKEQNQQLASEIGSLKAQLQNALNSEAETERKFINSQSEITRLETVIKEKQAEYADLNAGLAEVDNRENEAINGLSDEKRQAFYEIWDKWRGR